jgi:hypothetical protein
LQHAGLRFVLIDEFVHQFIASLSGQLARPTMGKALTATFKVSNPIEPECPIPAIVAWVA